ncbi:MAG: glycosyltransferase [Planctomycetota bacterium]|nr:MAG: glycosyltransferase [Planctomycetota bacterium]
MKVSVITAVYNRADTLEDCLRSVAEQTHPDVEHVVVDGGSTDGTLELLRRGSPRLGPWISEPDRGIYDALNKGLALARGEVVGVLGSDDVYADPDVLAAVAAAFAESGADSVHGDLLYVRRDDPRKVVRRWISSPHRPGAFARGWMPPHPTFFVRRAVYEALGPYRTDFAIAADYELMLRYLERHGISNHYLPRTLVRMRTGGASNQSPRHLLRKTYEDCLAWRRNGLPLRPSTILRKNLSKLPQFFRGGTTPYPS